MRTLFADGTYNLTPRHIDRNANAIGLSLISRLVIDCICSYADQDGKAWPTQEAIAHECQVGEDTAGEHVRYLRDQGVLLAKKFRTADGSVRIEYDVRPLLAFNAMLGEVEDGTPPPRLVAMSFTEWRDAKRAEWKPNKRPRPRAWLPIVAPFSSAAPPPALLAKEPLGALLDAPVPALESPET